MALSLFSELLKKGGLFKTNEAIDSQTPSFGAIDEVSGGMDFHNGCCSQSGCTCNGSCRIEDDEPSVLSVTRLTK